MSASAFGDNADSTPPSAPTNLIATATEDTTIALSWDASSDNIGVVNYSVYRNNFKIAYPTDPNFIDTGLNPSTSYFYYIKAYDAAGNVSLQSNTATATTLNTVDTTSPTSPTNLTVTGITASTVSLSWSAATDDTGVVNYSVYRNNRKVAYPTGTTFTDTGLTGSTTYEYFVKAYDAAGNVSGESNHQTPTTSAPSDATVPSTPSTLTATATGVSTISLSWTASTDNVAVTGYNVYKNGVIIATPSTTTYTSNGLTAATAYNYFVTAIDAAGNESAHSNTATATTQSSTTGTKMLIGGRAKSAASRSDAGLRQDFSDMNNTIGPLKMTRGFEATLPSTWTSVSAPGVTEFISYKNSGSTANFTSYINSLPAGTKLIFYHEPEGPTDWPSGAAFVTAYTAEYDKAKSIRPSIQFGMIAGGFQYKSGKNGYDGSYLPPANKVDFYGFDSYRDGTSATGPGAILPLQQIAEFQTWYNYVKNRGKDLYMTEYGRGVVGLNEIAGTPAKRAQTMTSDATYLASLGFKGWLAWYCNFGPDGRSWQWTDSGSDDAWSTIASNNY